VAAKGLSKRQYKAVKRVADRRIARVVETKRFSILNEQWAFNPTGSLPYQYAFVNLFTQLGVLGNGTSQSTFLGTEIADVMFDIRVLVTLDWNLVRSVSVSAVRTVYFHFYVLAVNDQFEQAAPAAYTNSITGGWFLQMYDDRIKVNGDNATVVKHKKLVIRPPSLVAGTNTTAIATVTSASKKIKFRLKGKKKFEEGISPVGNPSVNPHLKGYNYYLVAGWSLDGGSGLSATPYTPCAITIDRYMYYKDP